MSDQQFADLDPDVPLALLPVRLESRYLPHGDPTHLCVRIFPDLIHADGHQRSLTAREAECGRTFWTMVWGSGDATVISTARAWLADQSDPYRALWISTAMTPANVDDQDGTEPEFPDPAIDDLPAPVRAAMLPDQWMVRLYDDELALAHTAYTADVVPELALAPTLSSAGVVAKHPVTDAELPAPLGFLTGQDLLWTVDFDIAVKYGMGIRIPIDDVPEPVGAVLVLGVRSGRTPIAEAAALSDLLEAHWYTRGLDAVPQGTPTNNTDAGRSGVSLSAPDIDELFELEAGERPLAPLGRAALLAADPALMYRLPAADTLSLAIGRLQRNPLDRIAHAEWGEGAAAWAMNAAAGYATIGAYLSGPFAGTDGVTVAGDLLPTLRDWYADWVRGGSVLPAIRCGEQPYGVLPVTHRPAAHPVPADFVERVEHHVDALRPLWEQQVPTLDPDATDGTPWAGPAGDAAIIATVLGAVPHLTEPRLRAGTNHLSADVAAFDAMREQIETYVESDNSAYHDRHPGEDSALHTLWFRDRKRAIFGLPEEHPPVEPYGLLAQQVHADLFAQELRNIINTADYGTFAPAVLGVVEDEVGPLLDVYRDAYDAVPEPLWMWATRGGLGRSDLIALNATTFAASADPIVDLVTTDGEVDGIRDIISRYIDALDAVRDGQLPREQRPEVLDADERASSPLLVHLLDLSYFAVPIDDVGRVLVSLQVLRAMIDSTRVDDAEAQLVRLLRETLGIVMYRLDAWITSLAAQRLAERRRDHPAGVQVGGFGWLLDLRRSQNRVSQGFIAAPSMNHAVTAAVLRSGWSAYGTTDANAPLSVDLTSDRVRGAQWILDALRAGQDLAELLGARFERYLHELHVDEWIESVRRLALTARSLDRPPSRTVDGLLVARASAGIDLTTQEDRFRSDLQAATVPVADPVETANRAAVRRAWRRVAADLDAVADVTMAQAVHSLVQGNDGAATAAMAVTGGGDGGVPPIDVSASERDAQLVHHRVAVVLPGTAPQGEGRPSIISVAEPRLVPWALSMLPVAGEVTAGFSRIGADDVVVGTGTVSLDELGLSALDAALLAGGAPSQADARLGRFASARLGLTDPGLRIVLDTASAAPGTVSFDDFGLLGAALVRFLGQCRALAPADLARPEQDAAGLPPFDVDELTTRAAATEQALSRLADALGQAGPARLAALAQCAAIGVSGVLAALEAGMTDEAIAPVVAAVQARLASGSDGSDGNDDPAERIAALIGTRIPALPVFTPPADADRAASARAPARQRQGATEGPNWLLQVGRVRPTIGAYTDVELLGTGLARRRVPAPGLAQMPHTPGPWAAVDRPADEDDRVSIVSLTGADGLATDGPIAGLFVDGWTEGIPRRHAQAAIAVHFDAPTARPPQSILVSVVDPGRGFSADELSDQLLHTIELAKLRAVPADALPDIGHYLPAVLLPEGTTISGGN